MTIDLNGRPADVPDGATVADVLGALQLAPDARGVAVAVAGEVVPRPQWSEHVVDAGARVEVVGAIQGG